ncbi:MAG: hypothetical protein VW405_23610 [Rhodospirillaceae bacterium]
MPQQKGKDPMTAKPEPEAKKARRKLTPEERLARARDEVAAMEAKQRGRALRYVQDARAALERAAEQCKSAGMAIHSDLCTTALDTISKDPTEAVK